jgi:hypothetical protein
VQYLYHINEGTLNLFNNLLMDKSVNALSYKLNDSETVQVIVSRDQLEPGETLEQSTERQLRIMARQVKQFVKHNQSSTTVGTKGWPGIMVHSQFMNGNQPVHQIQIVAQNSETSLLIFTLSTHFALTEKNISMWQEKVNTFIAH